jgi:hypothetical protein
MQGNTMGKETVKLCAIGLCLVGAVFLLWRHVSNRRPGGVQQIEPGQAILTLCTNPNCNHQSEMDKRAYYEEVDKLVRLNPRQSQPPLPCSICGKKSVFRAVRCPQCDHVFLYGRIQHDVADRCPKCRYSQMEEDRRAGK